MYLFGHIGLLVVLGFLLFWPIIYKPLWNTLYLDLSFMKQWVFSQVLRFSSEPPVPIFESLIQGGGSSSLILEPLLSGWFPPILQTPKIDVLQFFPHFHSRVHTQFHVSPNFTPNPRRYYVTTTSLFLFPFSLSLSLSLLNFFSHFSLIVLLNVSSNSKLDPTSLFLRT